MLTCALPVTMILGNVDKKKFPGATNLLRKSMNTQVFTENQWAAYEMLVQLFLEPSFDYIFMRS